MTRRFYSTLFAVFEALQCFSLLTLKTYSLDFEIIWNCKLHGLRKLSTVEPLMNVWNCKLHGLRKLSTVEPLMNVWNCKLHGLRKLSTVELQVAGTKGIVEYCKLHGLSELNTVELHIAWTKGIEYSGIVHCMD